MLTGNTIPRVKTTSHLLWDAGSQLLRRGKVWTMTLLCQSCVGKKYCREMWVRLQCKRAMLQKVKWPCHVSEVQSKSTKGLTNDPAKLVKSTQANILKADSGGFQKAQIIFNFPQKDFSLIMFSHIAWILHIKKDIKLAYSQKMPFWFKKLQILVTYVLLTLNFLVKIYAFFQQSFWAWKAESANIFAGTNCQVVQDCWYR